MKFAKKVLSLLLIGAMIFSLLCTAPISGFAATSYTKVVPNNSANTILSGGYKYVTNTDGTYNGEQVTAIYNSLSAKISEMKATGGVSLDKTPAVTFLIKAPADGDYSVYVNYGVGSEHLLDGKSYKMVAAVNGPEFYTGSKTIAKSEKWQTVTEDYFTFSLKKGVNIVRFLPCSCDDWNISVWVDFKALYIDSNLSAVNLSTENPKTELAPAKAQYRNYYTVSGDNLTDVNPRYANEAGITFESLKVSAQLAYMPYYSYTLDIPSDGNYLITQSATVRTEETAKGYMVIRVDDKNYKRGFFKKDTKTDALSADLSVYMTKGTHTVTVTSPIVYEGDLIQATYGGYPTLFNMNTLTVYGGAVVSSIQKNPLEIATYTKVIEAESDDAVQFGYIKTNSHADFSGGKALSYASWDYTKAQTKESLKDWFDKSNMLSASFGINITESGTYTFTPLYEIGVAKDGYSLDNYTMKVLVDDKTLIEVPYIKNPTTAITINCKTFDVDLTAGYHVIRMIPITRDDNNGYWTNLDGLAIPDGVSKVTLSDTTRFEAEQSKSINLYNTKFPASAQKEGYIGNSSNFSMIRLGVTTKNVNADIFAEAVPHFAFTVNAPYNGYYDMTAYFNSGYTANTDNPYRIVSYINGECFVNGISESTDNVGLFAKNKANVSAYLNKGENVIAIGAVTPFETVDGFTYGWIDYDALEISGGASLCLTQKNVTSKKSVVKADGFAKLSGFTYKDSSDVNTQTYSYITPDFNGFYHTHEQMKDFIEPAATPHAILAINAPKAGKYPVTVRFRFKSPTNDNGQLTKYVAENGFPYLTAIANGEAYKFEYAPTKQSATAQYPDGYYPMSWWVTSPTCFVELKEGFNLVYFTNVSGEIAEHISSPGVDIANVTIPESLKVMNNTYIYYKGDANGDNTVNILDILRMKLYFAGLTNDIDIECANVVGNGGTVDADDLASITKAILDPKGNKELLEAKIRGNSTTDLSDALGDNDTLEILGIGNSFSDDALQWVYQIAQDLGIKKVVVANLYIGGCSLSTHVANASGDLGKYEYRYNDNGSFVTTPNYKMSTALAARDWDFVSLQQASSQSGVESSYNQDLTYMIDYVKARTNAKLVWHMTWAYQQDSTHNSFPTYNKDQMTMYNAIVSAVKNKIVTNSNFDYIVPNGTAVQNSRTSMLGDSTTRDGFHMTYDYGRYLTGLNFVKTITGLSIDNIKYRPSGVSEYQRDIAVESVNNSQTTPFAVTKSKIDGKTPGAGYVKLTPKLIKSAYWNTSDSTNFNTLVSTASNSPNYFATAQFSKEELPVGSIIMLESGWQYRPEGWKSYAAQSSRPETTAQPYLIVTDEWWGDYTVRAFNISMTGTPSLANKTEEDVRKAFSIYVPVDSHTHKDNNGSCRLCGAKITDTAE